MLTEATRKTRTIGYFLERSFLLDERGFHFFLFSFHGESLTIFEKREKEREIILESFRGWHSSSSNEGRKEDEDRRMDFRRFTSFSQVTEMKSSLKRFASTVAISREVAS